MRPIRSNRPLPVVWPRARCRRATLRGQLAEVELRYAALDRAFADLAVVEEERLRAALRETVAALCEAALQPLALDPAALAMRVERAAAMLRRAADERHIRLHPDDIALVRASIGTGLTLEPDASLPRGALRIETTEGGMRTGRNAGVQRSARRWTCAEPAA